MADMSKLNLDNLHEDIIRLVGQQLVPQDLSPNKVESFGNHRNPAYTHFILPGADLIKLASTSKSIRLKLLPDIFKCLLIGGVWCLAEEFEGMITELESMDHILILVKHFKFGGIPFPIIENVSRCLAKMKNLQIYDHIVDCVIPTSIAQVFPQLQQLDHYFIGMYGVESLIYLNSRPIVHLILDANIYQHPHEATLTSAPITVAKAARTNAQGKVFREPTDSEQLNALVNRLIPIFQKSKYTLKSIDIRTEQNWLKFTSLAMKKQGKVLTLPALERIELRASDSSIIPFLHTLLKTSPCLTHLIIMSFYSKSIGLAPCALPNLTSFRYLFDDNLDVTDAVRSYLSVSNVNDMMLNGLRILDINKLYAPGFNCGALKNLEIVFFSLRSVFTTEQCDLITKSSPNIETLKLQSALWGNHMPNFIEVLAKNLPRLTCFEFDHSWAPRRDSPFPMSDGKTIRSSELGDFRIISVMGEGNTIEKEIKKRIREDIEAVTELYKKKFLRFATKCPKLEYVKWHCTPECLWYWEFTRDGGRLKISREESLILFEGSAGDKQTMEGGGGAVLMRVQS